ncbi:Uncharacterised protein [Citrobacter koseri]|nr:Uncharacterised protein [Citrobacter koseri]
MRKRAFLCLNELRQLKEFADNALIIIDDSRIYLRVMHEATGCKALPPPTEDAENAFLEALEAYSGTHIIKHYPDDQGYVVLWPKSWREFGVNTHILAGDRTAAPRISNGGYQDQPVCQLTGDCLMRVSVLAGCQEKVWILAAAMTVLRCIKVCFL